MLNLIHTEADPDFLSFVAHPLANMFPMIEGNAFEELKRDIEHVVGGLLSRILLFDAGIGATEYVEPTHDPQLPPWMVRGLRLVTRNQPPNLAGIPIMDDTHGFGVRRLSWGPKAREPYLDYANEAR